MIHVQNDSLFHFQESLDNLESLVLGVASKRGVTLRFLKQDYLSVYKSSFYPGGKRRFQVRGMGAATHQSGLLKMKLPKKRRMVKKNDCFDQGLRRKKSV